MFLSRRYLYVHRKYWFSLMTRTAVNCRGFTWSRESHYLGIDTFWYSILIPLTGIDTFRNLIYISSSGIDTFQYLIVIPILGIDTSLDTKVSIPANSDITSQNPRKHSMSYGHLKKIYWLWNCLLHDQIYGVICHRSTFHHNYTIVLTGSRV